MELDTHRRLDDILSQSSPSFKQRIFNVTQYQISREQTNHWASHLRLLSSADSHQHPTGLCSRCSGSFPFDPSNRSLRLTRPLKEGNCHHYIAVSYCWQYGTTEQEPASVPFHILDGSHSRLNKAPPEILVRAISFALSTTGANFIWIDQECIDQDDRTDKEFGVQSMDQVYHRAWLSLGLLNVIIETQSEMDALVMLYERRPFHTDREIVAGAALMYRLSQDRWYHRSWIFQESSLSLNLILLIRHSPLVQNSWNQGIPGEIKIAFNSLHRCSEAMSKLMQSRGSTLPGKTYSDSMQLMEEVEWWSASLFPEIKTRDFSTKRFACSAAEAMYHLEFRRNSRVADRLAIIANLCHYSTRMDTTVLNTTETSFSICLLALSILNGDMSLLIEDVPASSSHRQMIRQNKWEHHETRYSWTAPLLSRLIKTGSWRSSSYLNGFDPNMRLQLAMLSPIGLFGLDMENRQTG